MTMPIPPTITVVTICRNALPALRRTAESVLAQEYPGLEYWVIDAASTDGTVEFLRELAARGVRVVSEPDRGICDGMNKGVRLARGEWVAHLHAGDTYVAGALGTVVRHCADDPRTEVFCGWMLKEEEAGQVLYRCEPSRLPMDMTVNHPAAWVRRDVFERLGGFDERYRNAMDYDLFLRLHLAGCRFKVIPEPLAVMIRGGQSERSLWETLRETHAVRRRLLDSGWQRSRAYLLLLFARGSARRLLVRLGFARFVRWFRGRFVLLSKG